MLALYIAFLVGGVAGFFLAGFIYVASEERLNEL
jgi:hypothetical protein